MKRSCLSDNDRMQVSMQAVDKEANLPAVARSFAAGFFYAVIAILLCYCTLLQITRMERIQFTTHDDMQWDVVAHQIMNTGFIHGYLPVASKTAAKQGRF